ncbi:MAG: TrmH family RNA methyltransferase [Simkaniaceae bacterium]|jgi:tRNA G18 (ribose-2'-O)-methylase SpoU|nr:MAG: TrmH family RNA methyltransferase [Simkaniaceae bacterium]
MFTKEKFFSLTHRRRHKNAGLHLRALYEQKLPIDLHYRAMEEWLKLSPLDETIEQMTDRFHLHMKEAAISLQEHSLLVKRFDTLSDTPYGPLMIYLEDLRSAFNIGNILRTVEAFRLGTVIFSKNTPYIDNPKVQKTAMGTDRAVPTKQGDLSSLTKPLIALETVEGAPSIHDFFFPESFSLIIGNEEYGLKEETLSQADHVIQIPLIGSKNSLNVASAFAIVASHIKNQLSLC